MEFSLLAAVPVEDVELWVDMRVVIAVTVLVLPLILILLGRRSLLKFSLKLAAGLVSTKFSIM